MENILSDLIATIDNRIADLHAENAGLEDAIDIFQAGIDDAQHQLDNPLDGHLERTATAIITQEAPNPYGRPLGLLGRIEVNRRSIQQARTQIATNNRLIADLSSRRAIAVGRREFYRGYLK